MNRRLLLTTIVFTLAIILPNFFGYPPASASIAKPIENIHEAYDRNLVKKINSIDALVNFIDTSYKGKRDSKEFLLRMAQIISLRFYHGYSYYSENDNWIAFLSGKIIWNNLSAIVIPDDILKHPNAACSQQSIILMECAKRFGLQFRTISFDHHFATEIKIKDKWSYIDVNQEVIMKDRSLADLINKGEFKTLYKNKLPGSEIDAILAHPKYGQINSIGASKGYVFQKFTGWMSQYFFSLLLCIQILIYYNYKLKINKNNLL